MVDRSLEVGALSSLCCFCQEYFITVAGKGNDGTEGAGCGLLQAVRHTGMALTMVGEHSRESQGCLAVNLSLLISCRGISLNYLIG